MSQAILSERLLLVILLVPLVQVSEIQKDLTYRVVPRAVQDYDDSYVTTVSEDIDETQKVFTVADASQLSAATYIQVGKEEMYIEKVSGNKLTVKRGQDTSSSFRTCSWSLELTQLLQLMRHLSKLVMTSVSTVVFSEVDLCLISMRSSMKPSTPNQLR